MDAVACAGAPRDLGGDQGRACAALLRARYGGLLPPLPRLRRDAHSRHVLRDLQRYFPHQYEQLTGMARGAGLALSKLAHASVATLLVPTRGLGYRIGAGARLAVSAPEDAFLREARPEGRFAASELTRPSLTTGLLAVNAAGLAVATGGRVAHAACQAPAALLLRDCVERFESVAAATEWCLTRPCAPGTTLLLADATGELAGVEIAADARRRLAPQDGVLLPGRHPPPAEDLARALGDPVLLDSALTRLLGRHATADPGTRRLQVDQADSQLATASSGSLATEK